MADKKTHNIKKIATKFFLSLIMLLVIFSLAGCKNKTVYTRPSIENEIGYAESGKEVTLAINYYDNSGEEKMFYPKVLVGQNEQIAVMAVEMLCKRDFLPEGQEYPDDWQYAFPDDVEITVDYVQVSGNTANVNLLPKEGSVIYPSSLIKARVPISNTLIGTIDEVEYVNFFYRGKPINYYGMPLGAMNSYNGSPETYFGEIEQKALSLSYPMSIYVTLYFPDKQSEYLVCETRLMRISDKNGDEVVEALLGGPISEDLSGVTKENYSVAQSDFEIAFAIVPSVEVDSDEILENNDLEEEDLIQEVNISDLNVEETFNVRIGHEQSSELSSAAVICSLSTFFEDSVGIHVEFSDTVGDNKINKNLEDFVNIIGRRVSVYSALEEDLLLGEKVFAKADDAENPEKIVKKLISQCALKRENELEASLDNDWSSEAFNRIWVSGGTTVVDIKADVASKWEIKESSIARQELYAIINSLCEIRGINSVQVLIEGERIESYGDVILSEPLMFSPSLIKK